MNQLDNPALCPAPWTSLYVGPDGQVDNCCVGKNKLGNVQQNSIEQIVRGTNNLMVQKTMLDGKYPQGCSRCENKSQSLQKSMLQFFSDKSNNDYQLEKFKLEYLDVRWSNTCNLACVYCSPQLSSTWAQELNESIRIEKQHKNELLNYVLDNVENLKKVYLAGGEPLLMKENSQLISAIKQKNSNCEVLINTNLTEIKGNSIFQNLLTLKNTTWMVSVDDLQERFEYLRYPAQWSEFEENLALLRTQVQSNKIYLHMVFTALNALTIWDAIDWFLEHYDGTQIRLSLYNGGVNNGSLDIRRLPVEYQKQALDRMNQPRYQKLSGWKDTYDYVADLVYDSKNNSFLKYITDLDHRRGLNSKEIFPVVYQYL